MHSFSLNCSTGRFFFVAVFLPSSFLLAQTAGSIGQDESVALDQVVVSASRTRQDVAITPSSVTSLRIDALQSAHTPTLERALATAPGVTLVSNGGLGSQSSVFIRGGSSHHTLFVVDGVRMNDRSASYSNFLGGADLLGIDRVEILRGPQSTLYGSSALGGVILVNTTHGRGAFRGNVRAEAGSFETRSGDIAAQGIAGKLGYSAALGRVETDNDRPQNEFDQWSYSGRLEYRPTEQVLVGATLRGQQGDYSEPGSRLFPSLGFVDSGNHLYTGYAEWIGDSVTSRLTVAEHRRDYDFASEFGDSRSRNRREIADWQTTWDASKQVQVVAGVNAERARYSVNTFRTDDHLAAGYLSSTLQLRSDIVITAGLRYDDFDSFGSATTGRGGVAWLPWAGTKLRATYGTGFSAPGSEDRFGMPAWGQLPSPDLRAEKSRGWDAGVDQTFANGNVTLSATYFQNRFRDLFEYEIVDFTTFAGRTINRAKASSRGVELGASARMAEAVDFRLSYTYLDARNDITKARATRRPRHTIDADLHGQVTKRLLIGTGMRVVASRLEGSETMEDYTTARVYAAYEILAGLSLKLRVENALDESYEDVLGYPGLPRGVFGGVEWRF